MAARGGCGVAVAGAGLGVVPTHANTHAHTGTGIGAARRPARQTVDFSLKGPVPVTLDEVPAGTPGCSVVDLIFAAPSQVSELVFHNYYTAWLTVLVRMLVAAPTPTPAPPPEAGVALTGQGGSQVPGPAAVPAASGACEAGAAAAVAVGGMVQGDAAGAKARKESGWVVAVARKVLMPSPHLEAGSHDFVSILATESAAPWTELVAMRLVLRQPSPSWHTFHVEEIHVFAEPPRRVRRHGQGHGLAPLQGPSLVTPQGRPVSPALGPIGDQRAGADAYDSILLLLRHQTQATLKSSISCVSTVGVITSTSTASKTPATPTRARQQLPAYEINSLPPV